MSELMDAMTFSTIFSAFVAYFVYWYGKESLKSVEKKHGSEDYYREESMKVDERSEEFLYRRITTK